MYYESDLIKNLSENVRKLMMEKNISINELAKKTGLTFSVIRNIRDGKIKKINAHNICRLVSYFQVSPNQLLGTETIPKELQIKEEHVEFCTSFFEREAGDFLYDYECPFLKNYDIEYENCMVTAIHSFVEAHKMATGYYCKGFAGKAIKNVTPETMEEERKIYVLKKFYHKDRDEEELPMKDKADAQDLHLENKVMATGMAIQRLRKIYKLKRKQLAARTGLSEDCIYRIESGKNKKINYEHINLIARELLCTPDFLLGESCDPTCNRDGSSLFYYSWNTKIEFRHVQLGHDLSYALNYMDEASKNVVKNMIKMLNTMFSYKMVHEDKFGERLPIQEVFFREQLRYKEKHKNRGAHFYTKKYGFSEKGEEST